MSGQKSDEMRTYRFSNTERLIARGVVGIAALMLILNFVPPPEPLRNCDFTAIVQWQSTEGTARPVFLSLTAGDHEERYPVEDGKPLAMQVEAAHLSSFSIKLHF